MNKETNINFKEIFDYIRDKDHEIEHLRGINLKYTKEIEILNIIIDEIVKLADDFDQDRYDYLIPVYLVKETIKELKEGK